MNTAVPTPGGDDGAEERILSEAEQIVFNESERTGVEAIFSLAVRVGVMLNNWQELVGENYSTEWVEQTAMTLFNMYFKPFVPEFRHVHEGIDNDDE